MRSFKRMKFKTPTKGEQIALQEALLNAGYWWHELAGDAGRIKWVGDCNALYTEENGQIYRDTQTDYEYFNQEDNGDEYILTPQGTFAKVEDYYKQPDTKLTSSGLTISGTIYTDKHTYNWNLGEKPPLGLKPKKEHDQHRLLEIIDAMSRYASTGNVIPAEWFAEAQYLNGQMEGK